jgi:hypothetical protein
MTIETLLGFRNTDSTENINARLAGLVPKGIFRGGNLIPEPNSLQIRVVGTAGEPWVFLAISPEGMVLRNKNSEYVLPVKAGLTNVVVLRAKYLVGSAPIASLEVMTLGEFDIDPDKESLVRLGLVSPPAGAIKVLPSDIDLSFRDSVEGFRRNIVRGVVSTVADLPAVSGFPAYAEVNLVGNNFAENTTVTIAAGAISEIFPFVPAINFKLGDLNIPGLSRVNPSQVNIVSINKLGTSDTVTVTTTTAHNLSTGDGIRLSDTPAANVNGVWSVSSIVSSKEFRFKKNDNSTIEVGKYFTFTVDIVENTINKTNHGLLNGQQVIFSSSGNLPAGLNNTTIYYVVSALANTFKVSLTSNGSEIDLSDAGTGTHTVYQASGNGNAIKSDVICSVIAKTAPGVQHGLVQTMPIVITGVADPSFNVNSVVDTVIDSQTFTFKMSGYPTAVSGLGQVSKSGLSLPTNAVEIGENAATTAEHFENSFTSSRLAPLIKATAIGSSLQLQVKDAGVLGNSYTLASSEPGYTSAQKQIVLSGNTFTGGLDPLSGLDAPIDLRVGDIYVVEFGDEGTLDLWGFDGTVFKNLTSAATSTLLDFHRRNLLLNEKHLTENEKDALSGTRGVPSSTNRFVTQQDSSVLTADLGDALVGADTEVPSGTNRFLTEARWRGERRNITISEGNNSIELPSGRWVVGNETTSGFKFFNVVFKDSLDPVAYPGGPVEYTQVDFSKVTVEQLYKNSGLSDVLNPSSDADSLGIYPKLDDATLGNPVKLFVKLSQNIDNGDAAILYSSASQERTRLVGYDMLAGPQRIIPADLRDIQNKVSELRFNKGIGVANTTVTLPADLFVSSNLQNYKYRRAVSGTFATISDTFDINFLTGTGTAGIVNSFTLVTLPAANTWTRYVLTLNQTGKVNVYHIANYIEKSTDNIFHLNLEDVALPNLAFTQGEWLFASVAVKSNSTNTGIVIDTTAGCIEMYPYQAGNAREWGAEILCGDGVTSVGHFTGTDAHTRAMNVVKSGDTVKLLPGTYSGQCIISTDDITLEFSKGAVIKNDTASPSASINFSNWNSGTDVITSIAHVFKAGMAVNIITSGTLPTGIISGLTYYIINKTDNTFQLALTASGSAVDFNSQGTGNHTVSAAMFALNVNAANFKLNDAVIDSCSVAINFTENASTPDIVNPKFTDLVSRNFSATPIQQAGGTFFSKKNLTGAYTCTDGILGEFTGDFNSPSAINDAIAVAEAGDVILIYPGTYNSFTCTKDNFYFKGYGANEVFINGPTSITVSGNGNKFENLVCDGATGIDCSGTYNIFESSVTFSAAVNVKLKLPVTNARHYNFHPLFAANTARANTAGIVTIGDGTTSFGDYCGADAINQALLNEPSGTKLKVGAGIFNAINPGVDRDNYFIEGAGYSTKIQANHLAGDLEVVNLSGDFNTIKDLHLEALNNIDTGYNMYGVTVNGNENTIDNVTFVEAGNSLITAERKYNFKSGSRSVFTKKTGAPIDGIASWTVGDGKRSFGDINGPSGIDIALNQLPYSPNSTNTGAITAGMNSNQAIFRDYSTPVLLEFLDQSDPNYVDVLNRYIYIRSTVAGSNNTGSFKIVSIEDATGIVVERDDSKPWDFTMPASASLTWNILTGAKIVVLPGTYTGFTIPQSRNDIDLEAWGSDVILSGGDPLITVEASRCRIAGFRFEGTGVGIRVEGRDNIFERNIFGSEITTRYEIVSTPMFPLIDGAVNTKIFGAPENLDKTCYTVASHLGRGDFVGLTDACIQAAVDAAENDDQIKTVFIGAGNYSISSAINVPVGITVIGSGYNTVLTSTSSTIAFQLTTGYQSISGLRFSGFTNYVNGPATSVFARGNWLGGSTAAGLAASSTADNL